MKVLGIDLGKVRTGVAISDKNQMLASPYGVINEKNTRFLQDEILKIIEKENIEKIVLGLPRNMDGSEGESAIRSRKFAEEIKKRSGKEILFVDERSTTVSANNYLNVLDVKGKKRKGIIDAVSAVIILQSYLDYKK